MIFSPLSWLIKPRQFLRATGSVSVNVFTITQLYIAVVMLVNLHSLNPYAIKAAETSLDRCSAD